MVPSDLGRRGGPGRLPRYCFGVDTPLQSAITKEVRLDSSVGGGGVAFFWKKFPLRFLLPAVATGLGRIEGGPGIDRATAMMSSLTAGSNGLKSVTIACDPLSLGKQLSCTCRASGRGPFRGVLGRSRKKTPRANWILLFVLFSFFRRSDEFCSLLELGFSEKKRFEEVIGSPGSKRSKECFRELEPTRTFFTLVIDVSWEGSHVPAFRDC